MTFKRKFVSFSPLELKPLSSPANLKMESNLVAEFVSETGASFMEAYNYLQAKGWDLKFAIHEYLLAKGAVEGTPNSLNYESQNGNNSNSSSKRLSRGISRATDNINLVHKARTELGLEFSENGVCNVNKYFIETPVFTFTLPDLSIFPDDFREFLEKDLIEISSLVSLEQAGRLNWWADSGVCQRLWPLATTGDGNCLLHAASLGMWGFHDRLLTLRRALHDFLSSSTYKEALWRRWRWQLTRLNAEAGLVYTEEEWHKEWDSIVNMASITPRNSTRRRSTALDKPGNKEVSENATYESLEEIHVLALSHVLKRPIVVIADTVLKDVNGEALAPILFGGIYLPLEIAPSECHKSPLVLTFDAAHFSALVVMEKETFADKSPHPPAGIPLTDSNHKLLPVQFSVDPGEGFMWGRDEYVLSITEKLSLGTKEINLLLREYLDIIHIPLSPSPLSDDVDFDLEMDTPGDEEDIEKRFIEANELDIEDSVPEVSESSLFGTNKSRAAKQMKSVAKQFGSIGKTMSKKLRKNLGTITKITRSNSQKKDQMVQSRLTSDDLIKTQDYILCARLYTEARHEYQEEMIKNYLATARDRFEREKRSKVKYFEDDFHYDDEKLQEQAKIEGPKNCITQGCNMYGTVLTSYLCTNCYNKQRQEEMSSNINSPSLPRAMAIPKKNGNGNSSSCKLETPGYGTGRSTFYLEASPKSYESAKSFIMSSGKSLKPPDETLYLSNSTFYNDRSSKSGFYPKDWRSINAEAGRNVVQLSFRNDYSDRPKTWQEDFTNQIDNLSSLTLPTGFSPKSKHFSASMDALSQKTGGNVVSEEEAKPRTKTKNFSLTERHQEDNDDVVLLKSMTRPESAVSQDKTRNPSDVHSAGNLNAARQPCNIKTWNNNMILTVPVRQSSQSNIDELVKETAEYFRENNVGKTDIPCRLNIKPAEFVDVNKGKSGKTRIQSASNVKDYVDRKMCLNVTCKFFGSPELDNYCSKCHRGRYENMQEESSLNKK